ncbi:glycosyltransferase family 4 protein [Paenibacillus sp. YAF4_2]|uniref:glycosyltransferase family 4 protein n=1 Tax=Paenibacillus sp. YAF4_2 TaxID=3233085 RepID=UPI003F9DE115
MSTRKVAYVATVYSHLASFHIPFMKDLQEQGYEVHAYASPDHCTEDVRSAGFECRDIPFSRNPLKAGNVKAVGELTKWFKKENYDLIHVHTPNASVICRLAALFAGSRNVVYTAHGFHFFKGASLLNWLVYFPVEWTMSLLTDRLITINVEDYSRAAKFPVRGKVVYMPGVGIDLSRYRAIEEERIAALKEELHIASNSFVVLCIAELNRNKNQEQLIRAVRELKERKVPVVAVLAGTGNAEEEYKTMVKELGLEQEVRFLGYRKDVPELLNMADTLVLLSHREGLPKVLLETMGVGKPMVVTAVRGNRDLVKNGQNGFVVPVGEYIGTAQRLYELYSDQELRARLGQNGYEQAHQYDLIAIKSQMREVYAGIATK